MATFCEVMSGLEDSYKILMLVIFVYIRFSSNLHMLVYKCVVILPLEVIYARIACNLRPLSRAIWGYVFQFIIKPYLKYLFI